MNNDTKILLDAINSKYKIPTSEFFHDLFKELVEDIRSEVSKLNDPVFYYAGLGNQPYIVNYMNRRHIFAFNPTNSAIILTSSDGITFTMPAQVWTNIGLEQGTALSATSGRLVIKCTNEVAP